MTIQSPTRVQDAEEQALIEADRQAHAAYGPDESRWTDAQRSGYLASLATVRAGFPDEDQPNAVLVERIVFLRRRIADLEDAVAGARATVKHQQDEMRDYKLTYRPTRP